MAIMVKVEHREADPQKLIKGAIRAATKKYKRLFYISLGLNICFLTGIIAFCVINN
jgi:hypothetical protein